MKILLCAATEMEIAPVIHFLATHPDPNVDILITGIGLTASTYALTKKIALHPPELIIQAGIAGCLDTSLQLGQVVAVKSETIGDLGVKEAGAFQSIFDMKFLAENVYPWTAGKLYNENKMLHNLTFPKVNAVTVNEITTSPETISYYTSKLNVQIETMEGAALHYLGLMEKIRFLQIRSLSNFVGERDKTKWKMKEAIQNLNTELQHLLPKRTAL